MAESLAIPLLVYIPEGHGERCAEGARIHHDLKHHARGEAADDLKLPYVLTEEPGDQVDDEDDLGTHTHACTHTVRLGILLSTVRQVLLLIYISCFQGQRWRSVGF